jgi:acetyl esterase/lipase
MDPELAAVTHLLRAEYRDSAWTPDKVALMRDLWHRYAPAEDALTVGGALVAEDLLVPAHDDDPALPMLLLRPRDVEGPLPCFYHIHGGGMIAGDNRAGVAYLLPYAEIFGAAIASIEYRLAPENPYPAAVDDCFRGFIWLVDQADRLGLDPDRIAITGASAGGGLAASTSLRARDAQGPVPSHQLLLSPMIDDREQTLSSKFEGVPWDAVSNRTGWQSFLGASRGTEDVSHYAAIARATDLAGMPPTYVEVGGAEVFRDEVLAFVSQLLADGVPTELHLWSGAPHGFESYAPHATVSQAAVAARTSYIQRILAP